MDIGKAISVIAVLQRGVMWRLRIDRLKSLLARSIAIAGLISIPVLFYGKFWLDNPMLWILPISAFALLAGWVIFHWRQSLETEREAAFRIDQTAGLEDRIATSSSIIAQGIPVQPMAMALVEDAAERVSGLRPVSVMPLRWRRLDTLAALVLTGIVVLVAAPGGRPAAGEMAVSADIKAAGERLEQESVRVEQSVPPTTETALLAREQTELGRSIKQASEARSDMLRKLSSLEERIRSRHEQLQETRAGEIVSAAERRFSRLDRDSQLARQAETPVAGFDLRPSRDDDPVPSEADDDRDRVSSTTIATDSDTRPRPAKEKSDPASGRQPDSASRAKETSQGGTPSSAPDLTREPELRPEESGGGQPKGERSERADRAAIHDEQTSPSLREKSDRNPPEVGSQELEGDESGSEQLKAQIAAPEVPAGMSHLLSKELLKNADKLRAGELTPDDIRQIREAAELLARDLSAISQSQDLRKAAEQLVRQVRPEQIEQLARELMNQEQLRAELEAAAKLLAENQHVKQMVAGLAQEMNQLGRDRHRSQPGRELRSARADRSLNGGNLGQGENQSKRDQSGPSGPSAGMSAGLRDSPVHSRRDLERKGKGTESDHTLVRAAPGSGAGRAPYVSAYPRYRREAERFVERTRVPAKLRSTVRKYFDSINPNSADRQLPK